MGSLSQPCLDVDPLAANPGVRIRVRVRVKIGSLTKETLTSLGLGFRLKLGRRFIRVRLGSGL